MIFCKDLLFVHVPKTAGMAVTRFLMRVLPRPVYYSADAPLPDDAAPEVDREGLIHLSGVRHETLAEARDILSEHGFELEDFPLILAVMRNPYAIEVSRYAYLQKGNRWDRGYNQALALNEDFETFALRSGNHAGDLRPLEAYFTLDGALPPNLRIVRYEHLLPDLQAALEVIGLDRPIELSVVNDSRHDHFRAYYTQKAEEAVYHRYQWAFDQGFFERIVVAADASPVVRGAPMEFAHRLPVFGAAHQVGSSHGLLGGGWVAGSARCRIKARDCLAALSVEGELSHGRGDARPLILRVGGVETSASFESGGPFAWRVACDISADAVFDVELAVAQHDPSGGPLAPERPELRLTALRFEASSAQPSSNENELEAWRDASAGVLRYMEAAGDEAAVPLLRLVLHHPSAQGSARFRLVESDGTHVSSVRPVSTADAEPSREEVERLRTEAETLRTQLAASDERIELLAVEVAEARHVVAEARERARAGRDAADAAQLASAATHRAKSTRSSVPGRWVDARLRGLRARPFGLPPGTEAPQAPRVLLVASAPREEVAAAVERLRAQFGVDRVDVLADSLAHVPAGVSRGFVVRGPLRLLALRKTLAGTPYDAVVILGTGAAGYGRLKALGLFLPARRRIVDNEHGDSFALRPSQWRNVAFHAARLLVGPDARLLEAAPRTAVGLVAFPFSLLALMRSAWRLRAPAPATRRPLAGELDEVAAALLGLRAELLVRGDAMACYVCGAPVEPAGGWLLCGRCGHAACGDPTPGRGRGDGPVQLPAEIAALVQRTNGRAVLGPELADQADPAAALVQAFSPPVPAEEVVLVVPASGGAVHRFSGTSLRRLVTTLGLVPQELTGPHAGWLVEFACRAPRPAELAPE